MRTKKGLLVTIVVLTIALLSVFVGAKENREKVKELPNLVMAAIQNLFPSGVVDKIDMENEGIAIYAVDRKSGENVSVAKDGTVISVSSEIAIQDLPAAIAAAIAEKVKDAKVVAVEIEETKAQLQIVKLAVPMITYEVKINQNGKNVEIKIDAAGNILGVEKDEDDQKKHEDADDEEDEDDDDETPVSLDSLPAAVRIAIVDASEGGEIKEIVYEQENGQAAYEAEVVIGGQEFEIKVDENGKVLEKEAEKQDQDIKKHTEAEDEDDDD